MYTKCQECETTLWSVESQQKGLCPDCKNPDHEQKDLEDQLEDILSR